MEDNTESSTPRNEDSETSIFEVWAKYEEVAMHFNDLILKLRIQALGAVAVIITLVGVISGKGTMGETQWGFLATTFAYLLLFWIAIFILDYFYYKRLLLGAVDALLQIEEESKKYTKLNSIYLSHKIDDAIYGVSPTHRRNETIWAPVLYYLIVGLGLFVGLLVTFCKFKNL